MLQKAIQKAVVGLWQDGVVWHDAAEPGLLNETVLGVALRALSAGRNHPDIMHLKDSIAETSSFKDAELNQKELDRLMKSLADFTNDFDQRLEGLDPELISHDLGLSNLMCASLHLAIKDENPRLFGLILKLVLLLIDSRYYTEANQNKKGTFDSRSLKFSDDARCFSESLAQVSHEVTSSITGNLQSILVKSPQQAHACFNTCLGPELNFMLYHISKLLPEILPESSCLSKQAIEFLQSKILFVQNDGFEFKQSRFAVYADTAITTTIPADSLICTVSESAT